MATSLHPSLFYIDGRTTISYWTSGGASLAFGADAARRFERTCRVLAQLIDVSLMWAFLVAGIAQTVFLFSMVAGQIVD